jgi:hypothetical protein
MWIDSGSNTFISGALFVNGVSISSGSTVDTGSFITTGSTSAQQGINGYLTISGSLNNSENNLTIHSGSMKMYNESGSIRIATYNNQPALFYNQDRQVGFFVGQSNMDQTDTTFGITSDSQNVYSLGGNMNSFRSGSNNLFLQSGTNSLRSGSNNVFVTRGQTAIISGSNNILIGNINNDGLIGPTGGTIDNYFVISAANVDGLITKNSSNPLRIKSDTTVTGSMLVSGSATVTGSLQTQQINVDALATTTASLNLSLGNAFYVTSDNNPNGLHLQLSNGTNGQHVGIWITTNQADETVSYSNLVLTNRSGGSTSLSNSAEGNLIHGVVINGTLYANFSRQ